ncbi:MAG: HAD family hydrolase [Euryarchaeota archaeon]|nr:HAD family hydrolase [Euryarchaeota archaeon]
MQKQIAVVFDSAGTLLHMYRVAKEADSGQITENIESTLLVAQRRGRALMVLHIDNGTILSADPDTSVIDFIDENNVSIGISCSNGQITAEQAYEVIKGSNVTVGAVQEVLCWVRRRCPNIFYIASGLIVDVVNNDVPYVLSTGGRLYGNTQRMIQELKERGVDTYVASGDSIQNLKRLVQSIDIPIEDVYDIANTHEKERIVQQLKERYDTVLMVGDGMNDILALRAADVGVVTVQQGDDRPVELKKAADVVIDDIINVVDVVDELIAGKRESST